MLVRFKSFLSLNINVTLSSLPLSLPPSLSPSLPPGAGIFVTTIVVGVVTITKPFTLTQRPFLRDIIFYLFAVYWTFYLLWTVYVNIFHAVGFVVFYAFYVAVVIVGRIVFQKWKKYRRNKRLGTGDIPSKSLFIDCCVSDNSTSVAYTE